MDRTRISFLGANQSMKKLFKNEKYTKIQHQTNENSKQMKIQKKNNDFLVHFQLKYVELDLLLDSQKSRIEIRYNTF